MCGNNNNCGICNCFSGNNWWWIIILLLIFCNCGNGNGGYSCSYNDNNSCGNSCGCC